MILSNHIGKVTWAMADKMLFIIYGLVVFLQISIIETEKEVGLYGLLTYTANYIFIIADSFALQGLIQFGADKSKRPQTDLIATILFLLTAIFFSGLIYIFSGAVSQLLNEPSFSEVAKWLPIIAITAFPKYFATKFLYRDYKFRGVFFINLSYFGTFSIFTLYYYFYNSSVYFSDMMYLYVAGTVISSLVGIILITKDLKYDFRNKLHFKEFLKFAFPVSVLQTLNSLPKVIDQYILGAIFSTSTVGIYFSAKTLFRVFDEAANASYGLLYPGTVKLLKENNKEGIIKLYTKGVSFLFVTFLILTIVLNIGLTELLIELLLPDSFLKATTQFNILTLNSLGLPFIMTGILMIAGNKVYRFNLYNFIAIIVSGIAYYIIYEIKNPNFIAFGLISYTFTLAILSFYDMKKNYGFPFKMIFRAFGDSYNFVKHKLSNKQ